MNRIALRELVPSLIIAAGIVAATLVAKHAVGSGWLILAGPVLLAIAVVAATMVDATLRKAGARPSRAALILGGTCVLATMIMLPDQGAVTSSIPIFGVIAWTALLRSQDRGTQCTRA